MKLKETPKERPNGFILIPVLLAFSIIIAMVGDFTYEVFIDINSLKNYVVSQRLSVLGNSNLEFGVEYINNYLRDLSYTTSREERIDLSRFIEEKNLGLSTTIIDENAKFNLNSLYTHIPSEKQKALDGLKRLLNSLKLDQTIASRISDWIDRDIEEEYPGTEKLSKNNKLYSIEELLQIPGITDEAYEKLKPYITCYTDGRININSAPPEVLVTIEGITEAIAEAIINYRTGHPFKDTSQLRNVPGISTALYNSLQGKYTVKATVYGITIKAEQSGIIRYIYGVVSTDSLRLKYYREE